MILLAVVMAMLAILVASFYPSMPHLKPAPLVAYPPGCVAASHVFVPTNVTRFPDPALRSLSASARNRALLKINMQECTCGCAQSIVACQLSNLHCATSRKLLEQAITEEKK
ncbi:MAG TPA: hypothetical protein VKV79_07380 [Terriglobia bacterium]|nr:hypothetical protein [Terriglobia bacterium]